MHYLIEQQEQLLQDEEVDVKQFMKLDIEFHCVISRATNNEILKRLTLELVESYNRYILIAPFLDRANTIVSEHKRIIEAIKEEDGEKAAKIVQNHITDIRESLKERIEKIL